MLMTEKQCTPYEALAALAVLTSQNVLCCKRAQCFTPKASWQLLEDEMRYLVGVVLCLDKRGTTIPADPHATTRAQGGLQLRLQIHTGQHLTAR